MRRWGLCFGPAWGSSIGELTAAARDAEASGFDRVTVGEYHNDPLSWMQALACSTQSVRVASTILNIALRHPAVTAEAVAAMRDVHGPRIELGLGVSHGQILSDLGADDLGLDDLEEYAEIVGAVLQGRQAVGSRWRFTADMRRSRLRTEPIPVLAAALGARAAERAAAYADGLILTWTPLQQISSVTSAARRAAAARGRAAPAIWVVLPCLPARDERQAARAAARHLRAYIDLPAYRRMLEEAGFAGEIREAQRHGAAGDDALAQALGERLLREVAVVGGRAELEPLLDRLGAAGADSVILYPLDVGDGWRAAMDRTIQTLAPAL